MAQDISKKETTQTAVNFLINYMCANFHLTDESLQKFEQALAMEKEQIIDAFDKGWKDEMRIGEEYYNENYNQ